MTSLRPAASVLTRSSLLAICLVFTPGAGADIVLVDENITDRNADPTNFSFSLYNNAGPQSVGGSTVAEVGVVNPITGTVGDAITGTKSLTVFSIDDNAFTGNRESFELQLGDEGEVQLRPEFVGNNESTTAERNLSPFDEANGGTGTLELQLSYRVADISFVPGFDGGGGATLPTALPLNMVNLRIYDNDNNPLIPGPQPQNETVAAGIGLTANPFQLLGDDQWHTDTITMGVLDAATRAFLNDGGLTPNDVATVLQLTIDNTSDADDNIRIAYEIFFDNIRILTDGALVGDYNGDGFVSQGDLDLVLLNWGDTVVPAGFDESALDGGGPFDGLVSQNELDGVLLNWGDGTPPGATAIPEPASLALVSIGGLWLAVRRRRA